MICVFQLSEMKCSCNLKSTIHNLKLSDPFIIARILDREHESIYRKLGCDLSELQKLWGRIQVLLDSHLISGNRPNDFSKEFRITAEQLKEAQLSTNRSTKDEVNDELKQDLSQYLLIILRS